ncbi:MAG: hypothetical protein AAFR76_01295 [Planctomycetota bacterium]
MSGRAGIGVALAIVCAAGSAFGQNALGDGRRLDANQQVGSGGVNSAVRADFSAANALRAAIVTGNAPGGLSFRADVGYAAPREFRGELGSDDLFEFRRDSLYSGLSGQGIRGTDALQYQFALTTGSRPPRTLAGPLSVSRDSGGLRAQVDTAMPSADTSMGVKTGGGTALSPVPVTDLATDRGFGLWQLRSSAGYLTDRSIAESVVGGFNRNEGEQIGVTASPLGGVRTFDISPQAQAQRDTSAVRSDASRPADQPFTADTAIQVPSTSAYDRVVQGVRDELSRTAGIDDTEDGGVVELIEEQNRGLREFLASVREQQAPLPTDESETAEDAPDTAEDETLDDGTTPAARDRLIQRLDELGIDRSAIDALRSGVTRVDDLVAPGATLGQDFYLTHLTQGRELLRQGRFFDAEARFSLALSVREGDPTASIGRVHAQIGAGLFLSASLNLRETFTQHPMLIAARYAPDLLPTPERTRAVVDRLNARVDQDGSEARAAALLLAYVGRQADDEPLIRRGLGRIDKDGEDPLAQLLRLVWLNDADVQRSLDALGAAGVSLDQGEGE